MAEQIFNVLFLCTGNSARSILAESMLRRTLSLAKLDDMTRGAKLPAIGQAEDATAKRRDAI